MAKSIYTVGGAVQADQGIYITRRADDELLGLCRSGTFAYVLTARQMGKSSLMVSTAERLDDVGIRSVILDLQKFGTETTAEAWYLDLLDEIAEQMKLSTDVVAWWQARSHLGMAHRLVDFFHQVLLAEIAAPVIIFVDEIDTTLSLPFSDDFYAAIRALYEARTRIPALQRLSFVLIGVATPGDLIRDSKRTPFNIGQRVDLTDFGFEEALPFADGFRLPPKHARRLLRWALYWTNGHPYLTQRLCRTLAMQAKVRWSKRDLKQVVATTFLGEKSQQDNNIQFVRDMLTRRAPDLTGVLTTYRQIYHSRPQVLDEEQSLVKNHLKLSGIARRDGRVLRVRNLIYQRVFDERWIKEHLPTTWPQRLRRARRVAISIIIPLFVLSVVLASYAVHYAAEAEAGRQEAETSAQTAVAAQARAEAGQLEALLARSTAETSRLATLKSAQTAVVAQGAAEALRQTAETQALDIAVQSASDPELGLMIAIEGARRYPTNLLVARILRQAIGRSHLRAVLRGHTEEVKSAAFSPDGHWVVSTSQDTTTRLWAWDTIIGTAVLTLTAQPKGVNSAAFSPDGRLIVTAGQDTKTWIWDTTTGDPLMSLKVNGEPVYSAAFSPDSRLIVTGARDSRLRVWDAAAGALLAEGRGHIDLINSAVFSRDGGLIVTASRDKTARVWAWDNATRSITTTAVLRGHSAGIYSAAFSPDGQYVVTASTDGTARIWNVDGGEPLAVLRENAASPQLYSAGFSPDGQLVVIASVDGTAQVWDWRDRQKIADLIGHTARIWSVSFSDDGQYILTASSDGTARIWALGSQAEQAGLPESLGELLALARTRVTRELSPEEQQRYFPRSGTPTPAR